MRSKRESLARELSYRENEQKKVRSKLEKLENEDFQRRLALQRADPDCIRAADWVKNNSHRLKRKVWGPIALEVSDTFWFCFMNLHYWSVQSSRDLPLLSVCATD